MLKRKAMLCALALAAAFALAACAGNTTATEPSANMTDPEDTQSIGQTNGPAETQEQPTQTAPPEDPTEAPLQTQTTEPPTAESPATQPPVTSPPATEPPTTQPPATEDPYVPPESYEEYLAMSGEHQARFIRSFDSLADFAAWLDEAKKAYDEQNNKTYIDGDTVVDLEKEDN